MVFWLCLPLCIANFLTVFAEWINETVNSPFQPVGRSVQAAAWDSASQQLWIHAGNEQLVLEDLWTFDFESRTWDLKQQRRQYRPSARSDHVAVWDPERRSLWIHGGFTGTVGPHNKFFGDLWRYSGNSWTLEADETVYGPSPRSDHVAVWDAASSTLWIHGEKNGHGILLGDLWRFDSPPNRPSWSWSRVVDNEPPSARAHHVAVWDDTNAAIWVHGGYDGGLLAGKNTTIQSKNMLDSCRSFNLYYMPTRCIDNSSGKSSSCNVEGSKLPESSTTPVKTNTFAKHIYVSFFGICSSSFGADTVETNLDQIQICHGGPYGYLAGSMLASTGLC